MIVAGGVYREECVSPRWSRIFGSGGRAATALAGRSKHTSLHAYAGRSWADDAEASFKAQGIEPSLSVIADDLVFRYFHPMSSAQLLGRVGGLESSLSVDGDAVIRFGLVEGDAIVRAAHCVYDPQNAGHALAFSKNGSRADRLAVVLNETELRLGVDVDEAAAVRRLCETSSAAVVVVKRGAKGATVYEGKIAHSVPARLTPEVFKIGSGDVFTAVFAHHWAERGDAAVDAAEAASQAAAAYVATRDATFQAGAPTFPPAPNEDIAGPIYLAGPFFNLGQRWMVEQARDALASLGAPVFSPLHEVGTVGSATAIAEADLEGLRGCRSVLALVDGEDAGTLFEIGYACQLGIPVIALAENTRPEALTMLVGSGCRVMRDFTSAVYHAVWAAMS